MQTLQKKILKKKNSFRKRVIAEVAYPLPPNEFGVSDEVFFAYTKTSAREQNYRSDLITPIKKSERH